MATAVKSAQRVLELLEYFAEERRPAAVGEIAQTLGWPQSSTSVLLKCLSEAGYFDQDARRGMYVPNVRLALATAWIQEHLYSDSNLLRLLEQVKDRSGHTVMIGQRRGVQVRYLHVLQATREGRFMAKTGALRPLFRSAAGKMLLTTLTDREIAGLLRHANGLEADPQHRRELEQVRMEVTAARLAGFAMSLGTATPGAAALAILVPTARDVAPMSISLGGPVAEIERERDRLLQILREAVEPMGRMVAG
ncbi:MAG: helix-turn-helix domain-containing protein [Ottowia sp.]|nr:helix-turn-helix domain-containing protein [Rhodoferax sp.]MCB2008920.1 helix-turn-helix domain-containing protein [Rhodoferax sp.]MCB2032644.1 helix-turn-helix domain-containing protein [Ottowia sp.]MCB2036506.1 helix-turn-helix domain-containing protein [Ottowia sp.]MCB2068970.1 helix-turn-helix domain-containing protein [Ottowia sp.]